MAMNSMIAALLLAPPALGDELTTLGCVDAVDNLFGQQGWALTSEGYPVVWPGDIDPRFLPKLYPRYEKVTVDYDPVKGPLPAARSACAEHNNREMPVEYRVFEDGWGTHIVPIRVRDANGTWVAAHPPLDKMVVLEPGRRTVSTSSAFDGVFVEVPGTPMVARDLLLTFLSIAADSLGSPGVGYRLASVKDPAGTYHLNLFWLPKPPRTPGPDFHTGARPPCRVGDEDCIDISVPSPDWTPRAP